MVNLNWRETIKQCRVVPLWMHLRLTPFLTWSSLWTLQLMLGPWAAGQYALMIYPGVRIVTRSTRLSRRQSGKSWTIFTRKYGKICQILSNLSLQFVNNCLDKWSSIVSEHLDCLDGFIRIDNLDNFRQFLPENMVWSV